MALRKSPASIEFPDHTVPVAGDQGNQIAQEPTSGKQVYRRGAVEAQADIDIGTNASPHDLNTSDFESGPKNAGGAEALAGEITSQDSATFSVKVDWLNDENEVIITHEPAGLTDVTDVNFNLIMRSDRFELRVTDTSGGQNRIHGTANAH